VATLSRRGFVLSSVAAMGAIAGARTRGAHAATAAPFRSRTDLAPPRLTVTHSSIDAVGGYVLAAPFVGVANGTALISDVRGEPVWVYHSRDLIMNFRVQRLAGNPVLTWWEGRVVDGYFVGSCVIADETYEIVTRISVANGLQPEVHEFLLTERGTALISFNREVVRDLTAWGGPDEGIVVDGVVQEVDLATGSVVFEWHSVDHVPLDESLVPAGAIWDYFHLNSIEVDLDGDLLVSARHPCAVYKVDRTTGEVVWRLGGKRSDFALDPDGVFWFQHDARALPGGHLSLFDDGADALEDARESVSRVLVLALDEQAMTASLVRSFVNPRGAFATAMGNAQSLGSGGWFVGWGTLPEVTELTADGTVVFDATFPDGQSSYRAFRAQWEGRALDQPAVASVRNANGSVDVYASWNGATRVAAWRVEGGAYASTLRPLATAPRSGFETRIRLPRRPTRVAAVALDERGRELGRSIALAT
jgi:hypothetical protein